MADIPQAPVQLIPTAQIPSFEALEARVSPSQLDIFRNPLPRGFVSVIGDYTRNNDELPPEDSPLLDLRKGVEASQAHTRAQEEGPRLSKECRRLLLAGSIQIKLIGYINRGHQNLLAVGYPDDEAAATLRDFIIEQDSKAAEAYEDPPAKEGSQLTANDGTVISFDLVFGGDGPDVATKSRNALLRERLQFEWMSSLAIVSSLEQGLRQEAA